MSDVPEGYKMSEVGVIPGDWEVETIGDIFTFGGGYSASRDQLSSDGHCYLHYGDIHKSTKSFIDVQAEYPDIPKLNIPLKRISPKSLLHNGDVVFVDASEDDEGTSKHIVVVNNEDITYISGLHTIVAKSKVEILDNGYKRYCFQSRDIKRQFYFYAVGTKVSGISKTNIAKLQLPIPPLPEQQAIASALSDVDALTKKRNIKQGAMQQLLTDEKRLPGFGGGWDEKRLGEIADMCSGGTPSTSVAAYYKGKIPWVVIADMTKAGKYICDTEKYISDEAIKNSSAKLFNRGTLLFAMYASIGKCSIAEIDLTCNQAILGIEPIKIDTEFLYYYLFMNEEKFGTIGQTGTQKNLNKEMVQAISIPYPEVKEQQAIAQILSDMDTEIEALKQKQAKYKAIKQGMMQELLTGKTRLV